MKSRGVIAGRVFADQILSGFEITAWRMTRWGLRPEGSKKTTSSGRFRVKALPFGDYIIVAHPSPDVRTGLAPAAVPGKYRPSLVGMLNLDKDVVEGVEIPVGHGAVLEGAVLSADGSPARGATVILEGEFAEILSTGSARKTGADGTWRIEGVPPGSWTVLCAPGKSHRSSAPTYLGGSSDIVDADFVDLTVGETTTVTVRLNPAAQIAGTVTSPLGPMKDGALIELTRQPARLPWPALTETDRNFYPNGMRPDSVVDRVRSDAQGRYRLSGLAAGNYSLAVYSDPDSGLWAPTYKNASSSGEATTIRVETGKTVKLDPVHLVDGFEHQETNLCIVGRVAVGETLTAVSSKQHPRAVVDFQWGRDWHWISDAIGPTYEVTEADVGCKILVQSMAHGERLSSYVNYAQTAKPVPTIESPIADAVRPVTVDSADLFALPQLYALLRWLSDYAPRTFATLQPGNSSAQISATEASIDASFPNELRTLLRAANGDADSDDEGFLPFTELFGLDQIVEAMNIDEATRFDEFSQSAPDFVMYPFAGINGNNYYLRVEKRSGRTDVVYCDNVDGIDPESAWPTLDAFFGAVLTSITTTTPFAHAIARINKGLLTWDFEDE